MVQAGPELVQSQPDAVAKPPQGQLAQDHCSNSQDGSHPLSVSFHNQTAVHSQIAHQNNYGNVSYHYHKPTNDAAAAHTCQQVEDRDASTNNAIDQAILESLAFPEMTDRRRNIESPYRHTCDWIFDVAEYKDWQTRSTAFLWIKGKPGSGKSTLMSHLYSDIQAKRLGSSGIYLSFFFTARGTILERSSFGMIRALSNQIFQLDHTVRALLRAPFQERESSYGKISWQWQESELQSLFTEMVLLSAQHQQVTIFLDALDEAGVEAAEQTALFFHTLNDFVDEHAATLKIIKSCRHYPVPPTRRTALEIHVDRHNRAAIDSYIYDYVERYINDKESGSDSWTLFACTLGKMANGVFQWARLVMPLIRRRVSNGEVLHQLQHSLSYLSTDLDDIYKYIFEHVIEDKPRALRLFRWVCLASRPFTLIELRYALATYDISDTGSSPTCTETPNFIKTDERMRLLSQSWSGGLLEIVEYSGNDKIQRFMIRPVHFSVNNYLVTQGFNVLARFAQGEQHYGSVGSVSERCEETVASGHAECYWRCLQYVASEKSKLSHAVQSSSYARYVFHPPYLHEDFPLVRYAFDNIFYHARRSQGCRGWDLSQEVQLLQNSILTWTEVWDHYSHILSRERLRRGSTPLHFASEAGRHNLVIHLIEQNSDVNVMDNRGQTALHTAAKHGYLTIAQVLVEAGANINQISKEDYTPLILAAIYGHETVFSWLLQQGVKLATALYHAARRGQDAVVKLCVAAGADINARGDGSNTALQAAVFYDYTKTAELLLTAGADVNAEGGSYGTALQVAAYRNHTKMAGLLLTAGADVNAEGGLYGTALQAAAYFNHTKMAGLLLTAGADVNAEGGLYGTALQAAAMWYTGTEMVEILIRAGADVNVQGGEYGTALQAAASLYRSETLEILLRAGADVNAQGGRYGTALQSAVAHDRSETVKILLRAGADVNTQGGKYCTALQAAAVDDRIDIVQILLAAGADVNIEGGEYGTALQAALQRNNNKIAQLLKQHGATR